MTQMEGRLDRLLERIRELARAQAERSEERTDPPPYAHERFAAADTGQPFPAPVGNPLQPRLLELTVPELDHGAFLEQAYCLLLGRSIGPEELARQQQPRIRNVPRLYRVAKIARSPEGVQHAARTGLTVPELRRLFRWFDRVESLGPATRLGQLVLLLVLKAYEVALRKPLLQRALVQRRDARLERIDRHLPGLFRDVEGCIDRLSQVERDRSRLENHLRAQYAGLRAEMLVSAHSAPTSGEEPPPGRPPAPAALQPAAVAAPQLPGAGPGELDAFYLAFEMAFRGPEAEVEYHLEEYAPQIERALSVGTLALDLGCGRGEWLRVLQRRGLEPRGVDASPAMVAACRAEGLHAEESDALAALASAPSDSHALISALHLAEHLEFPTLFALVAQAGRVLKPGGLLILETPNPENVLVGSHTFYHDPTHRNPLTPGSMSFLLGYHGFTGVEVLRFNPYPPEARVPGEGVLTERWNGAFCGPTDFAVVGARGAGGPDPAPEYSEHS